MCKNQDFRIFCLLKIQCSLCVYKSLKICFVFDLEVRKTETEIWRESKLVEALNFQLLYFFAIQTQCKF